MAAAGVSLLVGLGAHAARLRFLFDHFVSPWNRMSGVRARRETALLLVGRTQGETILALADRARASRPGLYTGEDPSITLRRLYRLSAALKTERRRQELGRRAG